MTPPTKLVLLSDPIIKQLTETLIELEKDKQVSVVIITGKDKSFAAGADIK